MTHAFRSGMNGKMLGTGCCFHKVIILVALQAFHIGHAQAGGEIRILSIGLMSSSPSGIPENIYVRRPEGKPFINIPVIMPGIFIIFGSSFRCHRIPDCFQQFVVKGCRHGDCLREAGCHTGSCHPVKSLVPPVIGRDSQSGDCRRIIP